MHKTHLSGGHLPSSHAVLIISRDTTYRPKLERLFFQESVLSLHPTPVKVFRNKKEVMNLNFLSFMSKTVGESESWVKFNNPGFKVHIRAS